MATTPVYTSDVVEAVTDSMAIFLADLESGEILFATRTMEEMFGYHVRGELIGKNVDDLVPDSRRSAHKVRRAEFAAMPRRRMIGSGLGLEGRKSDGTVFSVDIMLMPTVLAATRRCVVGVVLDMTDRRKEG